MLELFNKVEVELPKKRKNQKYITNIKLKAIKIELAQT
jgi:hypothetical protein